MKIIHINSLKNKVPEGTCTFPALQTKMQLKTKELLKKVMPTVKKKLRLCYTIVYLKLFFFVSSFFGDNIVGRIISHHD